MKKGLFKVFGAFFVLLMMTGLTIGPTLASDSVPYLVWTGSGFATDTKSQYTVVTSSTSTWSAGTYVVTGTVTIQSRITANSTVTLILCDGAELNVKGIDISSGAALHIYGQRAGTGILNTTGEIGNYNTVNDDGRGKTGINASGTLNIYGGIVHATGGAGGNSPALIYNAGSGGSGIRSDGKLTVYGGNLVATGGIGGAGYSGGQNGSHGKAIAGEFTIVDNITLQTASGSFSQSGTYKGTWTSVTLEYNSPHTHSWSINTDPSHVNTATVCCESANCPYGNNTEYTVIIQASEQSKMYDGQPVTASFTRSDDFPEEITVSGISYTGRDGTAYAGCPASPSSVGKYTASATVSDGTEGNSVRISVPFEITARQLSCTVEDTTHTFDGTPHRLRISVTDPSAGAEIRYKDAEGLYSLQSCPSITNVSDSPKTVYFQIKAENYETVTGSAEIIVNPAATLNASALTTDQRPTACSLTYNGEGQPLVTAPSETIAGYTVQYSLDGNSWSEAIPTGKNAGEYTVLYKYTGDLNHCDYPADGGLTITGIEIAKKEVSLNWSQTELTYNGGLQVLTATAGALCGSDECSVTVSGAATNAGTYTATAASLSNRNYKLPAAVTQEFIISPVAVSAPTIVLEYTETAYTGSALEPAVNSVMNGSVVIDPEEYTVTYSDNINAGTANVRITDRNDGNYIVSGSTPFQITKAAPVVTAPQVRTDMVYSGESQSATEAAGSATGGTMKYAITPKTAQQPEEWQDTVPERSFDAGEYRIWYKVEGGRNYQDVSPVFVDFTVAPRPITITAGITAENKTYDRTKAATLCFSGIDWAACGVVGSDCLAVTADGVFSDADAAADRTVIISGLTLHAGDETTKLSNYTLAATGHQTETTAAILPKIVTDPVITLESTKYEFTGEAIEPVIQSVKDGETEIPSSEYTVSYSSNKDVGTANITIKDEENGNYTVSGSALFTITKKKAIVISVPAGVTATYSGESVLLGIAGAADGGTLQYAITPASATEAPSSWSDQIPSATDVNEYKLWYYVKADGNHDDTDPAFVQTKIIPRKITVSGIAAISKVYDGAVSATLDYTGIDWTVCGRAGDDDLSVTAVGTFSQADAGTELTVTLTNLTLTGAKAGNYILEVSGSQKTASADILKAASSVKTAPQAESLTANGTAQPLITAGEAIGGKMLYALGEKDRNIPEDELFKEEIPAAEDEGVYHVWYKCSGDANHTDTPAVCISVTVKAPLPDPDPEPDPEQQGPGAETEPNPQQEPDPEAESEPAADPEPEPQQESDPVSNADPNPDPESQQNPDPLPDPEPARAEPGSQQDSDPKPDPDPEPDSDVQQASEPILDPAPDPETNPQPNPQTGSDEETNPHSEPAPGLAQQEDPQLIPDSEQMSDPEPEADTGADTDPQLQPEPEQEPQPEPQQEQPSEQPDLPAEQETPAQSDSQPQPEPQQEQTPERPEPPVEQETSTQPASQPELQQEQTPEQPVLPPENETQQEQLIALPEEPAEPQSEQVETPAQPEQPEESGHLPTAATVSGGKYSIDAGKNTAAYTGPEDETASSVTIPAAVSVNGVSCPVTEIRAKAFQGMTELKQITIGKNVTVIGKNAFSECGSLEIIVFKGKKVISIGQGAFRKCVSLTAVTFPKGVETIGKSAFADCKKLKKVTIKSTKLKSVGKKAFKGISDEAQFKCPKKLLEAYTTMIRKAGVPEKAVFTR